MHYLSSLHVCTRVTTLWLKQPFVFTVLLLHFVFKLAVLHVRCGNELVGVVQASCVRSAKITILRGFSIKFLHHRKFPAIYGIDIQLYG